MARGQAIIAFAALPASEPLAPRATVLVPGEAVSVFALEAPNRVGQRTLERIARFSLSERLAEEAEDVHVVCVRGGVSPVALAVSRAQMDSWLEETAALGIAPAALVPDYLALPWAKGAVSILHRGDRVVARTDYAEGFCAEPDLAAAILDGRLTGDGRPSEIRLFDRRPAGGRDEVDPIVDAAAAAGVALRRSAEDPLAAPDSRNLPMAANLLSGPYRPLSGLVEEVKRWRGVAAAAVVVLVLGAIAAWLDLSAREAEIARLDGEIEAIYRTAFDPTGPIVDVRTQAERMLAALEARQTGVADTNRFPDLLAKTGPVLNSPDWTVDGVQFRDATLYIDLTTKSFQMLDRLREQLAAASLEVNTVRSSSSAESVKAQLSVREGDDVVGAL